MAYFRRIILYFDGASRNNPHGPAGAGFVLVEMDGYGTDGETIAEGQRYFGYGVSNNQAEYRAILEGLDYMNYNNIDCDDLYIRGDSEIVVNQINGGYAVRSHRIAGLYDKVMNYLNYNTPFQWRISHINRERNGRADYLANEGIDEECDDDWEFF